MNINDISFLQPLSGLVCLWFFNNQLDNADLPMLYNKNIQYLELTANHGVNSGTAVQRLAARNPIDCDEIIWDGVCGVDPLVEFNDPNLEQAVSNALAVPVGQITVYNILELHTLNACNQNISNLTGLENASNLVTLELNQNQIDKIEALKNLTALNSLSLADNQLANDDLESLKKLKNLRYLNLRNNLKITSGTQMQLLAENFRYLTCEQIIWDGTCGIDPNSAPVPNFISVNPNPVLEQQSLTLTASATDAENHQVQINVDWGDGNSSGYSALITSETPVEFTHQYAQPGNYNLKLIARDTPGLESEWSEPQLITVNGRNKAPFAAILKISPSPTEAEQTVQLEATATDEENERVQIRVDWGDGEISSFSGFKASSEVFSFTHIFQTAGNYEIKANARDEPGLAGPWSSPQNLEVKKKNTAPVSIIKSVEPEEGEIGERIFVRAEALDIENDQVRLRIDWGDGERSVYSSFKPSGTVFEFSHSYSRPGEFKITAVAEDERDFRGKWSMYQTVTIFAPNTGPAAVITQMIPQIAETGQIITVNATATDPQQDPVQMKINWGDETVSEFSPLQASGSVFTFTHVYAVPGNYTVKVLGGDDQGAVGNWSEAQYITIRAPHTPLTASIVSISPQIAEVWQSVLVTATAVDQTQKQVQLKIDWGDEIISEYSELKPSGSNFEFRHVYQDSGNFSVKVLGRDETGLEGSWSDSQVLVIKPPDQPPVATVESIEPNPVETEKRVTARFTATDPEKNPFQLKIDWGDGRISDYTEFRLSGSVFEFTPSYLNPGTYIIRVLARDAAGHEGSWSGGDTLEVIPTNLRPSATISSITLNPVVIGDSVTVFIIARDSGGDSVQSCIDWGDGDISEFSPLNTSGSTHKFTHQYTALGIFPVKALARDQHGLEGTWSTPVNMIVIKTNQPPTAYIKSLSPMTTTVNSPIKLLVAAADSNHDRVRVQVDWGDGDLSGYSALQAENTPASFSHSYNSAGTFGIKVRGKDENDAEGEWSAPMNVTIREVNVAPVARIDSISANPLLVGQSLFVVASATDLNTNDRVQIRMDWGDGTFSDFSTARASGVSASFTKIYEAAGEFQLKVIARDAAGLEGSWSTPRLLQVIRPNTAPRDSIVSISPKPAAPNAEVTVQARAWDAENDALQMKINWGDGNESPYASSQASGSLFSFTHRYAAVGEYPISITTQDPAGLESTGSSSTISVQPTGAVENDLNQVFEYALRQNYPNPFNNSTVIEYSLKESGPVAVQIFDPNGKEVRQLVSTPRERGIHRVIWDATDNAGNPVSSGLYFYRLKAKNQVLTKKLILLK